MNNSATAHFKRVMETLPTNALSKSQYLGKTSFLMGQRRTPTVCADVELRFFDGAGFAFITCLGE